MCSYITVEKHAIIVSLQEIEIVKQIWRWLNHHSIRIHMVCCTLHMARIEYTPQSAGTKKLTERIRIFVHASGKF